MNYLEKTCIRNRTIGLLLELGSGHIYISKARRVSSRWVLLYIYREVLDMKPVPPPQYTYLGQRNLVKTYIASVVQATWGIGWKRFRLLWNSWAALLGRACGMNNCPEAPRVDDRFPHPSWLVLLRRPHGPYQRLAYPCSTSWKRQGYSSLLYFI